MCLLRVYNVFICEMSMFMNLRAELQVGWRTVQLQSNLMLRVYYKICPAGLARTVACTYQPQLLV